MSTSLVTFLLLPVTSAAVVGISHSMVLSVAPLIELMARSIYGNSSWAGKKLHRHRHIEGQCNNIHKGKVRVGFWVGNCNNGHALADAYTAWTTMSRIFIEEVVRAQQQTSLSTHVQSNGDHARCQRNQLMQQAWLSKNEKDYIVKSTRKLCAWRYFVCWYRRNIYQHFQQFEYWKKKEIKKQSILFTFNLNCLFKNRWVT